MILEGEGVLDVMELIPGVKKEEYSGYVLYHIESLSAELKGEIRNHLVSVCHGTDQSKSSSKIYSYKATVKEFIRRYNTRKGSTEDRKKGMIGELLIHIILEIEGRFSVASPFFNMEERSFKKGYDVALFDSNTSALWIAEVKSGEKQSAQKDASAAGIGLINTAKNDLYKRLNDENESLWLNALNAARVSMSNCTHQKDAVIKLLEKCADDSVRGINSSSNHNVVLVGVLFHPMTERINSIKIGKKYGKIAKDKIFDNVFIITMQKQTYEAVYDFLESEA